MDYLDVLAENRGEGFNFDNVMRNEMLADKGVKLQGATKSGTTICGVVCKDGVVLAADTRATAGPVVADKCCDKVHPIADKIYCAGAGTAADLEAQTELMMSHMALQKLNDPDKRETRVCSVMRQLSKKLFGYQGYIGCALVLGGVDCTGSHLYQIYPHGSTDNLPFTAMGSGSLNAMAVLEAGYKDDMTIAEGMELCKNAILSGVMNDLGSGGQVDVTAITKDGADKRRPYYLPSTDIPRPARNVGIKPGMTPLIPNSEIKSIYEMVDVVVASGDGDVEMQG